MHTTTTATTAGARILLVAPEAPPYGGMALQAELLRKCLLQDGHSVRFLPSNFSFGPRLLLCERLPGLRTVIRFLLIWPKLWTQTRSVDVLHIFAASWLYFFAVVAPATIVARALGKRVVLNYRGGDAERFFKSWGWAVRPLIRRADVLTAPSRFLADLIQEYFDAPVYVVSNILDSSLFPYRARSAIAPRIVIARHLEKMYDIETALKAFRMIQDRYPGAQLAIAGTGSQEKELRGLVAACGLQKVEFLGHVPHADLPRLYSAHDLFLNTSRVDNFPGALLEASAAGLVIVSTAAGGIPFMYQHGKDALLVPPGDWQGLARAVENAIESPALSRELTRAGLDLVRSCAWANVRRHVYHVYGLGLQDETGGDVNPANPHYACRHGLVHNKSVETQLL